MIPSSNCQVGNLASQLQGKLSSMQSSSIDPVTPTKKSNFKTESEVLMILTALTKMSLVFSNHITISVKKVLNFAIPGFPESLVFFSIRHQGSQKAVKSDRL